MEDPNKVDTLMWNTDSGCRGGCAESRGRNAARIRDLNLSVRRAGNAAAMQAARARESPAAAAARRGQNAAATIAARLKETPQQAAERRARNAAAMQAARQRESPAAAAQRRALNAARMEALRARESPERAALRKAQNAARMQALRARDVPATNTAMDYPSRYVLVGKALGAKPGPMHDEVMERAVIAAKAEQDAVDRRQRDLESVLADIRKSKEILAGSHQEAARVISDPSHRMS